VVRDESILVGGTFRAERYPRCGSKRFTQVASPSWMLRANPPPWLTGAPVPDLRSTPVHVFLNLWRPEEPFRLHRLQTLGLDPASFDLMTFEDTLTPRRARELGLASRHPATEAMVVVLGSSGCAPSTTREFRDAIAPIPSLLEAQFAQRPEVVPRLIGIALDPSARRGAEYLLDLGEFDEVIAGGSLLNTATEKYIWGTHALSPGTPQVLLLERTVTWSEQGVRIEGERVLRTLIGIEQISSWVSEGAPIVLGQTPASGPDESE